MDLNKQLKDLDLVLETSLLSHYNNETYFWHSFRDMLEVFTTSKLRDYGPISAIVTTESRRL